MATGMCCFMATRVAMFSAKLDLPMPGRAARMIRSPRPRPVRTVSSRRNPVGMPLYLSASGPLIFCRLVRVSTMLEERGVRALESRPERISYRRCSAFSSSSEASGSSPASCRMSAATPISWRTRYFSWTISAYALTLEMLGTVSARPVR